MSRHRSMRAQSSRPYLTPILALLLSATVLTGLDAQSASEDVPEDVAREARAIAEGRRGLQKSLAEARTIYVETELLRLKSEEGDEAFAHRVVHYRYDDDTAIRTVVDVDQRRILSSEEIRHLPVRLTDEELEEARGLAFEDDAVLRALGEYREMVATEALVVRASSPEDPWFGQRVVRLLFRVERDYLSTGVFVNLTDRSVTVEEGRNER